MLLSRNGDFAFLAGVGGELLVDVWSLPSGSKRIVAMADVSSVGSRTPIWATGCGRMSPPRAPAWRISSPTAAAN